MTTYDYADRPATLLARRAGQPDQPLVTGAAYLPAGPLKLSLHRETVALLSGERLEKAAGGAPTYDKSCLLSCHAGCSAIGCTDGCPSYLVGGC